LTRLLGGSGADPCRGLGPEGDRPPAARCGRHVETPGVRHVSVRSAGAAATSARERTCHSRHRILTAVAVLAFLDDWDPALIAAFVAAGVSLLVLILGAPLRMWVERHLLRFRLRAEHEYEQRKQLRSLIGRHHGRLVAASESWSDRMGNLYYKGEAEGWLNEPKGYYFLSTCHRFLTLCSLVRAFERENYFIDARYSEAKDKDLDFLNFTRSIRWVVTDPALFRDVGLDYDETVSKDHFFADQLRRICDDFCPPGGECLTSREFEALTETGGHPFENVFEFFQGLSSREDRFRWDRVVCLHLLVMAFLNAVGYKTQESSDDDFQTVASKIRHREIAPNLEKWIPRLGLGGQSEARRILRTLKSEPFTRQSNDA
jgi:hypothetical protein